MDRKLVKKLVIISIVAVFVLLAVLIGPNIKYAGTYVNGDKTITINLFGTGYCDNNGDWADYEITWKRNGRNEIIITSKMYKISQKYTYFEGLLISDDDMLAKK